MSTDEHFASPRIFLIKLIQPSISLLLTSFIKTSLTDCIHQNRLVGKNVL